MNARFPEFLSASTLHQLIESGEVSPVEVMKGFLRQYELINPLINAVVAIDVEAAHSKARDAEQRAHLGKRLSPLDGIPVTVKDNIFVAGTPATWGSRLYRDFRPSQDDLAVMRLHSAGAIIVGKTNTPEFANSGFTDNAIFGPTRNPWNLQLTPGGSSGGAVAALAAGIGPLALGTDAAGSIRRPAAYTGVVGFRPTTGRIPRAYGFPPLAFDFQVLAPAARSVEDTYLLFRAMAGFDGRDRSSSQFNDYPLPERVGKINIPRLRIRCVFRMGNAPVDPQVRANVEQAAAVFTGLGHSVDIGSIPVDLESIDRIWSVLSSVGVARTVVCHEAWQDLVSSGAKAIADRGEQVRGPEYAAALDEVFSLRARFLKFFEDVDVLLSPASAALPWEIGKPFPDKIDNCAVGPRGAAVFSTFVNVVGLPAISVPVRPTKEGLPVGMQLVGAFGDDTRLLALADEFEHACPWVDRWPKIALDGCEGL